MQVYRTQSYYPSLSPSAHRGWDEIRALMCWFYNCGLQHRRDAYKDAGISISRNDQFKELTEIRKVFPEFADLAIQVQRGVINRSDRAYQGYFRRVKAGENPGFPRFKSLSRFTSLEIEDTKPNMVKGNTIKIKGTPTIRLQGYVPDVSLIKKIVVTWTPIGKKVDIVYKADLKPLPASDNPAIGIDIGIKKRITLSNELFYKRREPDDSKKVKCQRELSRKQKGSKSWYKTARKLARLEYREKVKNRNEIHRITTELVRDYPVIVIEDLNIKDMTKSKGKWKKWLNREFLKQTPGMLVQQLIYKAENAGRLIISVDPRYTSQTCSHCRNVDKAARRGEIYNCGKCRLRIDADINAAKNILLRYLGGTIVQAMPRERLETL